MPPVELLMRSAICGPAQVNGFATTRPEPDTKVVEAAYGMPGFANPLKSTAVFKVPVTVAKVFGPLKPKGRRAASKEPFCRSELGVT